MAIGELLVESNHAVSGGAISFSSTTTERSNGTISIEDSTFRSNSAIMVYYCVLSIIGIVSAWIVLPLLTLEFG